MTSSLCEICTLGTGEHCPVARGDVRQCIEYKPDSRALMPRQIQASEIGDWQRMQTLCALELGLSRALDGAPLEAAA